MKYKIKHSYYGPNDDHLSFGPISLLLHVVGAGIVVKPLRLTFQVREGTGNMASGKGGNTPLTRILSKGGRAGQEKRGNTPPTRISSEGGV
jgi:hypothetical protein